ncbi:hypothetical protein DRW03_29460 [Corallococcus sp. H22C18031201]|uniref:TonB family protein n=1 Tax=Citreicoccus inhibens TaxID=2849499 RepID=UPI000E76D79F|nr:TonB family protein [Citreicoccus inhibens]MBU8897419.1 TonB family protein [Citreicoccus inhibens]RJS16801.1 hypothetical protein DRW03_29460 [Corallococcus sp. H22C18031201]
MAAAKKNGVTLRITGPDGSIQEAVVDADSVIVGSGAQAAVKIQDPRVSNLHVMLKVDADGSVVAIDLGSESGTQVRGERLLIPTPLKPGDVLALGGSRVEVFFGEPARAMPPAGAQVAGAAFQGSVTQRPASPSMAEVVTPARVQAVGAQVTSAGGANRATVSAGLGGAGAVSRSTPPAPMFDAPPPAARTRPEPHAVRRDAPLSAARPPAHLQEPLPAEAQPTADAHLLQVALLWGDTLLEVRHFRDGVPVTVGEGSRNAFLAPVPGVGARHVLAVGRGGTLELRTPAGAGVIVTHMGDVRTKDALRAAGQLASAAADAEQVYTLGLHDRAEVALGALTFVLRQVRPSAAIEAPALSERDFAFFKITVMCLMVAAALLAALTLTPRTESRSADDIFESQQRVAKFLIAPEKKVEMKKLQLQGVEEGAKAKDEEGKFGKEEAKKAEADPSRPGTPVVDRTKKEKDRQVVGKVGLLGAFKGLKGGASDVFGPGGLGTGINNALGGLKGGAGMGDAQGVGGMGTRGTGKGGGGTALGIGGVGTQGDGRGAGGSGGIDLGGRGKSLTKVIPGKTTVVGGLDKDVIAKVIRRHQGEIKYCYESELNKNPSLAGKVAVAFTIDPTGAVADASVSESTLGSTSAENCMLARIRRWKFPEPKGGGVVSVTYPWLFSPAGADVGGGGEG